MLYNFPGWLASFVWGWASEDGADRAACVCIVFWIPFELPMICGLESTMMLGLGSSFRQSNTCESPCYGFPWMLVAGAKACNYLVWTKWRAAIHMDLVFPPNGKCVDWKLCRHQHQRRQASEHTRLTSCLGNRSTSTCLISFIDTFWTATFLPIQSSSTSTQAQALFWITTYNVPYLGISSTAQHSTAQHSTAQHKTSHHVVGPPRKSLQDLRSDR
jgi:hypothetical protein